MFLRLYHLSSSKKHLVALILSYSENPPSPSLGFYRPRRISGCGTNVLALLFLLGDFHFNLGNGDVCLWSPCPFKVFSCRSFFRCLVSSSSLSDSIFSFVCKWKISKNVKFYVWQVMHERVNTLYRMSARGPYWQSHFVVFFVGGRWRISIISFGDVILLMLFGVVSLRHLTCALPTLRGVERQLRRFLSIRLFVRKGYFCGMLGFVLFYEVFGMIEIIESLRVGEIFQRYLVPCQIPYFCLGFVDEIIL